jgi:SAM-dependent methyltransferase
MNGSESTHPGLSRKLAGALANSFLFAKARDLWEKNSKNWTYPLTKAQKLFTGSYLILADYATGQFPPKFTDREKAYAGEINYNDNLPGIPAGTPVDAKKPFTNSHWVRVYMPRYIHLLNVLDKYNIAPPQRILELGCGCGWVCEMLAIAGYNVVGTTIAPAEVEAGLKRKKALEAKAITSEIDFEAAPMESADKIKLLGNGFDCVFCFEALHHVFDWREALESAYKCLKPGGWFLIANEPKFLHTFVSYRVAKLSNTHEVGMSRSAIAKHLKTVGFSRVDLLGPKWYRPRDGICIIAQKPK